MENIISLLYILFGLFLRLAIPLVATVVIVIALRRLDQKWQKEAQLNPPANHKLECWKIRGCSSQQMESCEAVKSPLPCWQANRLPNGYLHEECLSCQVFTEAPIPALKPEPRRL